MAEIGGIKDNVWSTLQSMRPLISDLSVPAVQLVPVTLKICQMSGIDWRGEFEIASNVSEASHWKCS